MRFKRVYIEITNKCNLNCSFCIGNKRELREVSVDDFESIILKIKDYTNYIYLHVLGEPLLHSKFREILDVCAKYGIRVNITTNGVFLKNRIDDIKKSGCVRQINISLHSENKKVNYIEDILESVGNIDNIIINYRFWTLDNNKLDERMNEYFSKILKFYKWDGIGNKINDNTFISYADKFVWPDINNDYYEESGYCHGLKDHIGVLSDGRVVVCCLDSMGESNLGNILDSSMEEILNSDKVKKIIKGFNDRCSYLELCKHCSYKSRFDKKLQIK